jgi:hypothetical protein
MIPILVFWTEYTATAHGHRLKFVACENCSTEYVYLLEREAVGARTSMYTPSDEGAARHAHGAAHDTLASVLENDFDPVPCPSCGHYQRHMFPKLLGNTGLGVRILLVVVSAIAVLAAISALNRSVTHFQHPNDQSFGKMVAAWSLLGLLCLLGVGLAIVNKVTIRRFNPNAGDAQARIALGQSRAITRAQFEEAQRAKGPA